MEAADASLLRKALQEAYRLKILEQRQLCGLYTFAAVDVEKAADLLARIDDIDARINHHTARAEREGIEAALTDAAAVGYSSNAAAQAAQVLALLKDATAALDSALDEAAVVTPGGGAIDISHTRTEKLIAAVEAANAIGAVCPAFRSRTEQARIVCEIRQSAIEGAWPSVSRLLESAKHAGFDTAETNALREAMEKRQADSVVNERLKMAMLHGGTLDWAHQHIDVKELNSALAEARMLVWRSEEGNRITVQAVIIRDLRQAIANQDWPECTPSPLASK